MMYCGKRTHTRTQRGAASAKPVSEQEEVGGGRAVQEQLLGMERDHSTSSLYRFPLSAVSRSASAHKFSCSME